MAVRLEPTHDLRHHYLVETELAQRLRAAPRTERGALYTAVYDELFRRVPDHPQLKVDPGARGRSVAERLQFVRRFCPPTGVLLEIGAGDCAFCLAASDVLDKVVGIDVSNEIVSMAGSRPNLEVHVTDGITIPLGDASVDVAFSDQLMEHLHPDDAIDQLREIRRVLRRGGRYVCITPNRATGPHDISGRFEDVARGFHLREYSSRELRDAFRAAGFARVEFFLGGRGNYVRVPGALLAGLESLAMALPRGIHRRLRGSALSYALLGLNAVAIA